MSVRPGYSASTPNVLAAMDPVESLGSGNPATSTAKAARGALSGDPYRTPYIAQMLVISRSPRRNAIPRTTRFAKRPPDSCFGRQGFYRCTPGRGTIKLIICSTKAPTLYPTERCVGGTTTE